jgi:hypothetical protein
MVYTDVLNRGGLAVRSPLDKSTSSDIHPRCGVELPQKMKSGSRPNQAHALVAVCCPLTTVCYLLSANC